MPLREDPPNLAEVAIRAEIEAEIRNEIAEDTGVIDKALEQHDKRVRALLLSGCVALALALAVVIPLLGILAGVAVRLFYLVSGSR